LSTSRRAYRFVSLLLSFCLLFNLIGVSAADAMPGELQRQQLAPQKNLVADIGELPSKLPSEKLELTSKRTEYSTRYLNPDGSFSEVIYLEPQFYQDSSSKDWKKIDNTLKASI
jgi:hypothetical protein